MRRNGKNKEGEVKWSRPCTEGVNETKKEVSSKDPCNGRGGWSRMGCGSLPSKGWGASKDNDLFPLGIHIHAGFQLDFVWCKWPHFLLVSENEKKRQGFIVYKTSNQFSTNDITNLYFETTTIQQCTSPMINFANER